MRARVRSGIVGTYQVILMSVIIIVPSALIAQPPEWEMEIVDTEDVSTYLSLKLDTDGYPNISYRGFPSAYVRYAYRYNETWYIEEVDTIGSGTSLTIDDNDVCHITYGSTPDHFIKYARQNGSGWFIETIDTDMNVGGQTSIALDSNGEPHIGYCRSDYSPNGYVPQDPKYAWHDTSGWHIETIEDGVTSGKYMSLSIDSSDRVHIAYCTMVGYTSINVPDRVRYAQKTESGWSIDTLTPLNSYCTFPSLVLDKNDIPHISYVRTSNTLWYAVKYADEWKFEIVEDEGPFTGVSIAVDSAGLPHISYHSGSLNSLMYARRDPAGWHFAAIGVGGSPSIQLGPLCRPRIAYVHPGYDDLMFTEGPPSIPLLGIVQAGELHLSWISADEISNFWLYGAPNNSFFPAGMTPGFENRLAVLPPAVTSWSSPNGIGDPDIEWTYLLIPVDDSNTEIIRSNRLGERNLQMDIP